MFEQSLYEQKAADQPLQESDLFRDYEIKNWDYSPRLYKILGISAFVNLLAILIVGQTSLLTMKGCDSPLVNSVCQVLDTVYVGSMLFGTDREYVDAVYEKTDLGDAEITFVDVGGANAPLNYPEGYFQIANPEEFAMLQQQPNNPTMNSDFPGIPIGIPTYRPQTGSSLLDTTPNIPKPKQDVVDGDLPGINDSGVSSTSPMLNRRKGSRGGKVANVPERNPDGSIPGIPNSGGTTADNTPPTPVPTPLSSDAVTAVEINKKPLADFAEGVATRWDKKEIDLNQDFTIVLNGVLTKDGKLDSDKSKFDVTKQKGDPKMIDVGKAALLALADSGYLTYLKSLDVDKITATLVQDDDRITVVITSSQKTPERASTIASGLNGYISLGKIKVENPSDERTLLDGAKVTTDGKNFVLNFSIPKPVAQEMITRKLKEAQAKKAQPSLPISTTIVKPNDNTAKK